MRSVDLGDIEVGITRLRDKAGASPRSLFDLVNGFVTASRSVKPRPGSRHIVRLPPGTKGLTDFEGTLWVFANAPTVSPDMRVQIAVTMNPADPDAPIFDVHFAEPYLGFLYVVVQFVPTEKDPSAPIWHYWLQSSGVWQPNTVYQAGTLIEPTIRNGLAFKVSRSTDPAPFWEPSVPRAIGDRVSPTVPIGFDAVVVDTIGNIPISGTVEPNWPAVEGALVIEDVLIDVPTDAGTPGTGSNEPEPIIPPSLGDRFDGGSGTMIE